MNNARHLARLNTPKMQPVAPVSEMIAFLMMAQDRAGESIEYDSTSRIFTKPQDERMERYITGRFRVELCPSFSMVVH